MERKIVVNLFGGPGVGKSTCAAYIYSQLKPRNIKVEMVFEFPKDLVYLTEIRPPINQAFVFGNQLFKIEKYIKKADVVIVDSPLPLSIIYNDLSYLNEHFSAMVMDAFNYYNNMNYLLDNHFVYNCFGRFQQEKEATIVHDKIKQLLYCYQIPFKVVSSADYQIIVDDIVAQL